MIKRVMLIQPPVVIEKTDEAVESTGAMTPLGLGYIASVLEAHGYEVSILDAIVEDFSRLVHEHDDLFRLGLSWEKILERIGAFGPDLVGISCMFTKNYRSAYQLARLIKTRIVKETVIVAGGVHATVMPRHVLDNAPFDFLLKGEAEIACLQLIEQLNGAGDFSAVDGLVYRNGKGIVANPKNAWITDLDGLGHPARHLMNMDGYKSINRPYGQPGEHPRQSPAFPLITSRSCKARCCFCETWKVMGPKVRLRSAQNVLQEIEELVDVYGCREFNILDDNILVDKARAETIFDGLMARDWDLVWRPMNGISMWSIDEDLIRKMHASGCYSIHMAVESGCERVLRNIIKKPLKLRNVAKFARLAKELGMETVAMFVIGLPGETKDEIEQTVHFAEELDVDKVVFSIATPFPGTRLYETCAEKGYLVDSDLERLRFGQANIETPDFTPAYLKSVRRNEWVRINYTRKGLKPPD